MENGICDPESRMLRGFLRALPGPLEPGGEGVVDPFRSGRASGLRTRAQLLEEFGSGGIARRRSKRCSAAPSASRR